MKIFLFSIMLMAFSGRSFGRNLINLDSLVQRCNSSYVGESVSVFFVSARRPFLTFMGTKGKIKKVFKRIGPFPISQSNNVDFGEISIPAVGFRTYEFAKFNYIYFVIHDSNQESVILRNVDGSIPDGQEEYFNEDASFDFIDQFFISYPDIGNLP